VRSSESIVLMSRSITLVLFLAVVLSAIACQRLIPDIREADEHAARFRTLVEQRSYSIIYEDMDEDIKTYMSKDDLSEELEKHRSMILGATGNSLQNATVSSDPKKGKIIVLTFSSTYEGKSIIESFTYVKPKQELRLFHYSIKPNNQ
jgi:hypothetical protein